MRSLQTGDELVVTASDPGLDGAAWCRHFGHTVAYQEREGALVRLRIRKVGLDADWCRGCRGAEADGKLRKTMVVFSGDLDKVLAAFVLPTERSAWAAKW